MHLYPFVNKVFETQAYPELNAPCKTSEEHPDRVENQLRWKVHQTKKEDKDDYSPLSRRLTCEHTLRFRFLCPDEQSQNCFRQQKWES